jgi:beta-galactosidase
MIASLKSSLAALVLLLAMISSQAAPTHTFVIGDKDFLLDGKPFVVRCGEMHFARIAPEYWRHRLQMAKAMGLNTVCAYLFWNFHEWNEGKFDWDGWQDVAQFCRIAQEEGLWVLVRPGPYSCAEWEMGGLPWWLVKQDGIHLRTTDPKFLEPAVRYFKEVARVLKPLQITHGGPVIMVQVENEYGSFGKDANYMGILRQTLIDGGINVPLFACNPPGAIGNGFRSDLFQVVNFKPGAAKGAFETLRKFQKTGPLMNGEFYPAWFDMWGYPHRTTNVNGFIGDLEYMLKNNESFSIYMAHGGTSFGLWPGADRPFRPDTSSYDYDAPISEAGWVTPSFEKLRELFGRHLLPGEKLPAPPPANPVIEIAPFALTHVAPVMDNLGTPVKEPGAPKTMEFYDQSRGCIDYRTTLPAGPAGTLEAKDVHDFAWIFVDGKLVGVMDRRNKRFRVKLPARTAPARLDILVEAMGRVNFGAEIFDRKGLHAPITFAPITGGAATELKGWDIFRLPLDDAELAALKFQPVSGAVSGPAFWGGHFMVAKPGDTFLDMRGWGKGVVWVNGHCLGRFWDIGPQQTMYCPGPWLKAGKNDVVILDLVGPRDPKVAGLAKPILDQLRPELDFGRRVRASGTFSAEGITPAASGSFTPEITWQEARFTQPVKGRYLCLEALDSTDGKPLAAVAELDALDTKGDPISKALWNVLWVDSEETNAEPGDAENALDGQPASHWHTEYEKAKPGYPHRIVLDMGEPTTVAGIRYLPRGGKPDDPGRIKNYRVYVSDKPFGLTPPQ